MQVKRYMRTVQTNMTCQECNARNGHAATEKHEDKHASSYDCELVSSM